MNATGPFHIVAPLATRRPAWLMAAALAMAAVAPAAPAKAQTAPTTPLPGNSPGTDTPPNAETPKGGIARGVIVPPQSVDRSMVSPPPAEHFTMPVVKPPGTSPGTKVVPK